MWKDIPVKTITQTAFLIRKGEIGLDKLKFSQQFAFGNQQGKQIFCQGEVSDGEQKKKIPMC